jgi:hypothetical protein
VGKQWQTPRRMMPQCGGPTRGAARWP